MKIMKSFLLITVCICAANFLQAQEIKTEVRTQAEVKPPPPATETNKPSPVSLFKPMDGITPKEATFAATEALSPATADKVTAEKLKTNNNTNEKSKPIVATPLQDVPQNPKDAIPAPGTLKKHNR